MLFFLIYYYYLYILSKYIKCKKKYLKKKGKMNPKSKNNRPKKECFFFEFDDKNINANKIVVRVSMTNALRFYFLSISDVNNASLIPYKSFFINVVDFFRIIPP